MPALNFIENRLPTFYSLTVTFCGQVFLSPIPSRFKISIKDWQSRQMWLFVSEGRFFNRGLGRNFMPRLHALEGSF
jgi:hypothetical protein